MEQTTSKESEKRREGRSTSSKNNHKDELLTINLKHLLSRMAE